MSIEINFRVLKHSINSSSLWRYIFSLLSGSFWVFERWKIFSLNRRDHAIVIRLVKERVKWSLHFLMKCDVFHCIKSILELISEFLVLFHEVFLLFKQVWNFAQNDIIGFCHFLHHCVSDSVHYLPSGFRLFVPKVLLLFNVAYYLIA